MNKTKTYLISIFLLISTTIIITAEKQTSSEQPLLIYPSYFSWQNINGTDYTTPIKDQSPAPTCEAYALVAALETKMQYQLDECFNPDLSEAHLYFYAGGTYEAGYVNIIDAANYLINIGVPDEGCYPDPHRPYDYPFESLSGWENRTVKIQNWGWVDHDIESIKTALIEHGPLIICIFVWTDFFYYTGGVYEHKWGTRAGGHVVTITGYDDSNECWIVKNSWGSNWGENGWFRMSYHADMFAEWYGENTGIMYLEGVYGNLKPNVPKVYIQKPDFYHTYLLNFEIPIILKKLPLQKGAPRIIGKTEITVPAENTDKVEFYVDNELQFIDDEPPYNWNLQASRGLHTLEIKAYNNENISIDIIDFQKLI